MRKPLNIIGSIFAVIGTLMAGGAIWAWTHNESYVRDGIEVRGTVIDLDYSRDSDGDGSYRPVVRFTDREGQSRVYYSNTGSNPPSYTRGEEVTLYYLPDQPERALIDSFTERYLLPLIFGIFGLVFGGIGYGLLFARYGAKRRAEHLKANGLPIQAKFVECYRDTTTKVNGRSPWRVTAQAGHPASGKQQDFVSEMIWVDLTDELTGKRVPVLVDPADPESYLVDLSQWMHDEEQG